jgi:hypothetical protein
VSILYCANFTEKREQTDTDCEKMTLSLALQCIYIIGNPFCSLDPARDDQKRDTHSPSAVRERAARATHGI